MRIGVDVSTITENKAGVGYYIFSLIKNLLEIDPNNQYILFTNKLDNIQEFAIHPNAFLYEIPDEKAGLSWIRKIAKVVNKETDIFLSPANFTFSILCKNSIQIIHDLAPIKYPQFFSKKGAILYRLQLEIATRKAKKIITPLEAIRQEIIQQFPLTTEKVLTIGGGAHDWTADEVSVDEILNIKRKYSLPGKFFLTAATLEPRKNHINIIKAFKTFSRSNPDYYYVIVGKKGWFYEEIFKTVEKLGLKDKIIFLGYVPEEDLGGIYKNASAAIFCSFYEGFALPPLEAASFNLPLVLSNISAFKEVFGDLVNYVNAEDTKSIHKGMKEVIQKKRVNYDEVLSKFSWKSTAQKVHAIITT